MPTPSVPSGPGIHPGALRSLTGRIFAAVATMSPPSPMTMGRSRVSSQSRTSRHMRCGSIGTSSLSRAAFNLASALNFDGAQFVAPGSEKSSLMPWCLISSSIKSKVRARLPTNGASVWRFWPISVASMSSWMIFASSGIVWPKRMRKSSRVPAKHDAVGLSSWHRVAIG